MSTPAARLARALALRRPTPPARPQTIWAGADAWRTRRRPLTVGKTPVEAEFVHDAPRVSPEALARAREQHEAAMRDFKAALLAEVDEMVVRGALPELSAEQKGLLVDWNLSSE
mmetsp:Transcript_21666/g.66655  ORF Transcript_21666/g.66655 Transcript_21666/m.66655 type:complete len:114 (+) Transcript_21666:155-496(+)